MEPEINSGRSDNKIMKTITYIMCYTLYSFSVLGSCIAQEAPTLIGFSKERVSVDINANCVADAMVQLKEQAAKYNPKIEFLNIEVDSKFEPSEIRYKAENVTIVYALYQIASSRGGDIEMAACGDGVRLVKVTEIIENRSKVYLIPISVMSEIGLAADSKESMQKKFDELGINLSVDDHNKTADHVKINLRGSQLNLKGFAMLVASVDLTNARLLFRAKGTVKLPSPGHVSGDSKLSSPE
jgi:hypothetical protein